MMTTVIMLSKEKENKNYYYYLIHVLFRDCYKLHRKHKPSTRRVNVLQNTVTIDVLITPHAISNLEGCGGTSVKHAASKVDDAHSCVVPCSMIVSIGRLHTVISTPVPSVSTDLLRRWTVRAVRSVSGSQSR